MPFPRLPARLAVVPCGGPPPELLAWLADELAAALGRPAAVAGALDVPLPRRGAPSGAVLDALEARADEEGEAARGIWSLAVSAAALRAPDGRRVFGEAAVGGCCAAVALPPLRAGRGRKGEVLRARLRTSALHELGHLAGAEHCADPRCVMFPSLHIADTDRKGDALCARCRADAGAA